MGVIESPQDLEELLDSMQNAGGFVRDEDHNALSEFNYALNDLYDWADSEGIWLGTR